MKKVGTTLGSHSLVFLLSEGDGPSETWSTRDLGAILKHQLATRLDADLPARTGKDCSRDSRDQASACACTTFADLLRCQRPSAALLRNAKDFAKDSAAGTGPLPKEVARFLYVLVVLKARNCGAAGVSKLGETEISRLAHLSLTADWLPAAERDLLRASLAAATGLTIAGPMPNLGQGRRQTNEPIR